MKALRMGGPLAGKGALLHHERHRKAHAPSFPDLSSSLSTSAQAGGIEDPLGSALNAACDGYACRPSPSAPRGSSPARRCSRRALKDDGSKDSESWKTQAASRTSFLTFC